MFWGKKASVMCYLNQHKYGQKVQDVLVTVQRNQTEDYVVLDIVCWSQTHELLARSSICKGHLLNRQWIPVFFIVGCSISNMLNWV